MYHYVCYPNNPENEFGLEHLQGIEEVAVALSAKETRQALHGGPVGFPRITSAKLIEKWEWVLEVANETGQTGKDGIDVRVFWIPTTDGVNFGFAFRTSIVKGGLADEQINVFSPIGLEGLWMNVHEVARYD